MVERSFIIHEHSRPLKNGCHDVEHPEEIEWELFVLAALSREMLGGCVLSTQRSSQDPIVIAAVHEVLLQFKRTSESELCIVVTVQSSSFLYLVFFII